MEGLGKYLWALTSLTSVFRVCRVVSATGEVQGISHTRTSGLASGLLNTNGLDLGTGIGMHLGVTSIIAV